MAVTILLVDDDAHVRVLLRERLESAGYQIVEASTSSGLANQ